MIELFLEAKDIFLHLDAHLVDWTTLFGPWLYLILFVVIFAETGLVVTPFLPGDSLLFAVGAIIALPGAPLQLLPTILLLIIAGILGDAVNYAIGYRIGPRVFRLEQSRIFNKKHLERAQHFYEQYGGKAIVFARFVPIVRTFAPFVAGVGKMKYRRFAQFNVFGAVVWVSLFIIAGYQFGNVPAVKRNFQYVILAIIFVSVLPGIIEFVRERKKVHS